MPDPAEFRRFLLVCAEAPEDAGQVPGVLAAAGCSCDIVYRRGRTATVTFDPSRHRGLFILGDSADRASARCYDREREWARVAIARGLPVLGICHGAQLLADLHGGRLTAPNRSRNIDEGLGMLSLTDAGRDDPVLQQVTPGGQVYQYHCETFTVPPTAVNLADSGNRAHPHSDAYRIGTNVYGVQFHPELTPETLAEWLGLSKADAAVTQAARTGHDVITAWVHLAVAQ